MHGKSTQAIKSDGRSSEITSDATLESLGTVRFTPAHNVIGFKSRSARVEEFIQTHAQEYVAKKYANVFVWPSDNDPTLIVGFYSLSACSVERKELNRRYERKAPPGIPVPMALIGYMGKAPDAPKGFGAVLIRDAALRMARPADLPIWGIALHPENEALATWYETLGFTRGRIWVGDNHQQLVMALS